MWCCHSKWALTSSFSWSMSMTSGWRKPQSLQAFAHVVSQPRAEILKCYHASESTEGSLIQILLGPTPVISGSVGWGRSCELASLTSYQWLLLLVWKQTLKLLAKKIVLLFLSFWLIPTPLSGLSLDLITSRKSFWHLKYKSGIHHLCFQISLNLLAEGSVIVLLLFYTPTRL